MGNSLTRIIKTKMLNFGTTIMGNYLKEYYDLLIDKLCKILLKEFNTKQLNEFKTKFNTIEGVIITIFAFNDNTYIYVNQLNNYTLYVINFEILDFEIVDTKTNTNLELNTILFENRFLTHLTTNNLLGKVSKIHFNKYYQLTAIDPINDDSFKEYFNQIRDTLNSTAQSKYRQYVDGGKTNF